MILTRTWAITVRNSSHHVVLAGAMARRATGWWMNSRKKKQLAMHWIHVFAIRYSTRRCRQTLAIKYTAAIGNGIMMKHGSENISVITSERMKTTLRKTMFGLSGLQTYC